jgi:hypothetical protein
MTIDKAHEFEKAIIAILNLDGWNLKWTGEGTESWDAVGYTPKNKKCVLEIKVRNKYYPTKLLEKLKYDKLMALDKEIVKLYYVLDPQGNYLYWLNDLNMPELETKDVRKTTLWDNDKTSKQLYMLPESKASVVTKNTPERAGKRVWDEYFKRHEK